MNSFRLRSSERDVDEAAKLLQSKGVCLINIFDPAGNETSLRLNTRRSEQKGHKYIELDFWRSGCDFSESGQKHFKSLGYRCGPRVIAVEARREDFENVLDQMLQNIFSADMTCFNKI